MELQFNKQVQHCLHRVIREYQTQEQTQELRLPEGMPDIGTVLACWGQVILRGKEWRSETVGVSGGVTAHVIYLPEGGGAAQSVEAWLPFQMKWNIPQTEHDGSIVVLPQLRSADARCLSARKLMIRTNIGVMLEAVVQGDVELYTVDSVDDDIQLLKRTYRLRVPREAGERGFQIDEDLELSSADPKPEQILRFSLQPEIIEKKLMADKAVFRGMGILHVLYRGEDGQLSSKDFDVPFSQYGELEGEYRQEDTLQVIPVVTNLELEMLQDGQLHLKAGVTGQYMVYDGLETELIEDAYSVTRSVTPMISQLLLPNVLDMNTQTVRVHAEAGVDMHRSADAAFWPEQSYLGREGDDIAADLSGTFQLLYYDPDGQLQSVMTRWEEPWQMFADEDVTVQMLQMPSGKVRVNPVGGGSMQTDLQLELMTWKENGLPMVTGLMIGDEKEPDPDRPSLILQKAGNQNLWELAKKSGSTVEAIQKANKLQQDPSPEQTLIIPVL